VRQLVLGDFAPPDFHPDDVLKDQGRQRVHCLLRRATERRDDLRQQSAPGLPQQDQERRHGRRRSRHAATPIDASGRLSR
jgi:hypothetical protein